MIKKIPINKTRSGGSLLLKSEDAPHEEAAKFVCKEWETNGESLDLCWALTHLLKDKPECLCFDALARVLVSLAHKAPKVFTRALHFDLKLALDSMKGIDPTQMTDKDMITIGTRMSEWNTEENRLKREEYIQSDE